MENTSILFYGASLGHHEGDEGSGSGRRGEEEGQDQEIRRGAPGGDILE